MEQGITRTVNAARSKRHSSEMRVLTLGIIFVDQGKSHDATTANLFWLGDNPTTIGQFEITKPYLSY